MAEKNLSLKKPRIVVIVGPTASGKTWLAVEIAKHFNGEVISADSRQMYRGLDIGTEKITEAEMDGVPHHLIDVCEPTDVYTAVDWARDATSAITDIISRGKLPIIAGGTFFYIEALLYPEAIPHVPPNPTLRRSLEELTTEELYEKLKTKDPARAETIDAKNPRRLVRALEIIEAMGNVPTPATTESPYEVLTIGIDTDKEVLRQRIAARLTDTLKKGLVAETESLLKRGISKDRLNEIGLEYRVVIEYQDGLIPQGKLLETLDAKVWQYAKRQLTWLKRQKNIQWFKKDEIEVMKATIEQFTKNEASH